MIGHGSEEHMRHDGYALDLCAGVLAIVAVLAFAYFWTEQTLVATAASAAMLVFAVAVYFRERLQALVRHRHGNQPGPVRG
jgi:hypothetical protein